MKWFGSSGIRGIVNKFLTPELAMRTGIAVGHSCRKVIIGRDTRPSGKMIFSAVVSGLTASGTDVTDAGMLSTPTLAWATRNYECGIMITASHNPAEYNGIKLWNPDGMAFNTQQMLQIEKHIENSPPTSPWNKVGRIVKYGEAVEDHIKMIMNNTKTERKRIVLDAGAGGGATITPYLLRKMGHEVITLNSQTDGMFPGRKPEPVEENLHELIELVKASDADIGLAHDGDADRVMAVDDRGRFLTGNELLAILGKFASGEKMVAPVNTSLSVDEFTGKKIYRCKVGDVYVGEMLKKTGAGFGGESSGTFIYPEVYMAPDGILAAAKIVELASRRKLSELKDSIPAFTTIIKKIHCANEIKKDFVNAITKEFSGMNVNTIDGIRVDDDNGWRLIRPSGTEPLVRITVESHNKKTAEDIMKDSIDISNSIIENLSNSKQ